MPFSRLIGNVALSFVTKLSTGYWTIFDPTNGYVAIHALVLRQFPLEKLDRRYFFESDMLFWLNTVQAKVVEMPMPARYGNFPSSLRPLRMVPYFLRRHIANTAKRLMYNYFIRNFSIASIYLVVGLVSLVGGVADGAWEWWRHVEAGRDAPLGTIMIPTMMILVGVQLLVGFFAADVASAPQEPIHPRLALLFSAIQRDPQ
jgi:dolichol-phosphate mannosyltransferase